MIVKNKELHHIIEYNKKNGKILIYYYIDVKKAMLNKEKYFIKIKNVLEYLNEKNNLCIIVNFLITEIKSSKKNIKQIIEKYIELNAIYKENKKIFVVPYPIQNLSLLSPELYYGDYSVYLFDFVLMKKPILLHNLEICKKEQLEYIYPIKYESFVKDGDEIYFAASEGNGLFKANLRTCCIEFLVFFTKESDDQCFLYTDCVRYEDKVIFAPGKAEHIAIYSLTSNSLITLTLPTINYLYKDRIKFSSLFIYDHYIYFIPNRWPMILQLDMKNYEMIYFQEWYIEYEKQMMFPDDVLFLGDYTIVDDSCYVPFCQLNMVLEINLLNKRMQFHKLGNEKKYFSTICYDGEKFWITGGISSVLSWNKETGEVQNFDFPKGFIAGSNPFIKSCCINGTVIVFPGTANMIIAIDTVEEKIYELNIENFKQGTSKKRDKYCIRKDLKDIYVSRLIDGKLLWLNSNFENIDELVFEMPVFFKSNFIKFKDLYNKKYSKMYERVEEEHQLGLLVKSLCEKESIDEKIEITGSGKKIYEIVKNSYI